MKAIIKDIQKLKKFIDIANSLLIEAKIKSTKDGIEMIATDPANVCMVSMILKKPVFVALEGEEDFCINIHTLKDMLKRTKADEQIDMEYANKQLILKFGEKTKRTFKLPTIVIDEKDQKLPELNFEVVSEFIAEEFTRVLEDVTWIGESAHFTVKEGKILINSSDGTMSGNGEITPSSMTAKEGAKGIYSVEYLKKICIKDIAEKLKFSYSKEYPLQIEYDSESMRVLFILAPRIEND